MNIGFVMFATMGALAVGMVASIIIAVLVGAVKHKGRMYCENNYAVRNLFVYR